MRDQDEQGATAAEYGLLVAGVVAVLLLSLVALGVPVQQLFAG